MHLGRGWSRLLSWSLWLSGLCLCRVVVVVIVDVAVVVVDVVARLRSHMCTAEDGSGPLIYIAFLCGVVVVVVVVVVVWVCILTHSSIAHVEGWLF
jgi:hypothetical protein